VFVVVVSVEVLVVAVVTVDVSVVFVNVVFVWVVTVNVVAVIVVCVVVVVVVVVVLRISGLRMKSCLEAPHSSRTSVGFALLSGSAPTMAGQDPLSIESRASKGSHFDSSQVPRGCRW
jgi:hypothetical protein